MVRGLAFSGDCRSLFAQLMPRLSLPREACLPPKLDHWTNHWESSAWVLDLAVAQATGWSTIKATRFGDVPLTQNVICDLVEW
eukprot:2196674-Amphidinium_carterae.1